MGFWDVLGDIIVRIGSTQLDMYNSSLKRAERQYRNNPAVSAHLADKRREYENAVETFKDKAEQYYEKRDAQNNGSDTDDY